MTPFDADTDGDAAARRDVPAGEAFAAPRSAAGTAPLPFRSFDTRGVVLTCSSFSETVAPGFRIGWVLSAARGEALLRRKLIASGSSPRLTQLAMARSLASGVRIRGRSGSGAMA